MRSGDVAHVWTHPSHVGGDFPQPRRVKLIRSSDWFGKTLWRCKFIDERFGGELDFNEDCMLVVQEAESGGEVG